MRYSKRFHTLLLFLLSTLLLVAQPPKSDSAKALEKMGFLNIMELDSTFLLDLKYTTPHNFTGVVLYTDLKEAYLHPIAANALVQAHQRLKELHPTYRIKIWDATRPLSVQQTMWNVVKGTPQQNYVSNPANGGGLHNYGLAVDVTLVDEWGDELPMGTAFDHLGKESHIDKEAELVAAGILSEVERQNRLLLRKVMRAAGYMPLRSEWWHFNYKSRKEAREQFKVVP
ncbi:MAG: M15 family metallopeptidase [Phocaeicola sp.]